jgi:hypothetical protein
MMKLASVYDFGTTVFDLVDIEDGPGRRSAAKLLSKNEARKDCGEYRQAAGAFAWFKQRR